MIHGVPSSVVCSGTGTGGRQGAHRPVSPTQSRSGWGLFLRSLHTLLSQQGAAIWSPPVAVFLRPSLQGAGAAKPADGYWAPRGAGFTPARVPRQPVTEELVLSPPGRRSVEMGEEVRVEQPLTRIRTSDDGEYVPPRMFASLAKGTLGS